MSPLELARWQWSDYARFHQDPTSLRLHILSVPVFWLSVLSLISWPWHHSVLATVLGLLALPVVLALQGLGHRRERHAPTPFTSPANAVARLMLEQLVTLPRFILSGQAVRLLRQARRNAHRTS